MGWYLAIGIFLAWLIVVIAVAVISHRRLDASSNPLEWLPFFFVGPFMFGILLGVFALLIPILMAAAVFALIMFPFHTVMRVTPEGLAFSRRIGGLKRVVKWSELQEIKEVKTLPFPTLVAVLRTGDEFELPSYPESLNSVLAEHGVTHSLEEDDEE